MFPGYQIPITQHYSGSANEKFKNLSNILKGIIVQNIYISESLHA